MSYIQLSSLRARKDDVTSVWFHVKSSCTAAFQLVEQVGRSRKVLCTFLTSRACLNFGDTIDITIPKDATLILEVAERETGREKFDFFEWRFELRNPDGVLAESAGVVSELLGRPSR